MRLTERDKLIIDTLERQDFCFYNDIKKRFFSSDASACNRLSKLKKQGYISIESITSLSLKKNLDNSSLGLVGRNLKIISLSDECSLVTRKTSTSKKHISFYFFL